MTQLRGSLDQPATIICADAGCGKTTLASDFVRSLNLPFVWYQIDRSDLDLAVFFGYLTYGIRTVYPNFGEAVLALIREFEGVSSDANQLVDALVNDISEQIDQKLIIVLDDYHHVDLSEPISAGIGRLMQYAPDVLHIIVTTRSMPNLPITRLRSKGLVTVLGRQELSFTREEVKELFDQTPERHFGVDLIEQLFERTRGWATGIQLISQAVEYLRQDNTHIEQNTLEILKRSEEEVFDYFAEEVFQYETPETQDALLKLSLFRRIDQAAASCVLPAEQAYQMLNLLQHSNLFLSQVKSGDEEEYSLHPMFRRFLRRRMKEKLGESGLQELKNQYADHLMKLGKWQKAGLMYAEAQNSEALARILVEHGRELLDAGLFEIVKRAYNAVSGAETTLHPEIPRLRAHIARIEGDLEMAERMFSKAASGAREIGDTTCEASSLHGLATVYIKRGEHARAFSLATEALIKAPPGDLPLRARCEHTIGNCQFLSSVAKGEFQEAIETWGRAAKLAREAGKQNLVRKISHNIGIPYAFTGEFARAREFFSQLVEGDAAQTPLAQHALGYCNLARTDLAIGELDSCERQIEKAFEVCRLFNLSLERAEAHEIAGSLHRDRGSFNIAREHYVQSENFYRDAGVKLETRDLPEEEVRLFLAEGNISKARDSAAELLEKRMRLGGAFTIARGQLLLAEVILASGGEDTSDLLQKSLGQFIECRANAWVASARFLLARSTLRAGDESGAAEHLAEALLIAREFSYDRLVRAQAADVPEIIGFAFTHGIQTNYLESLGIRNGEAPAPEARIDSSSRSTLSRPAVGSASLSIPLVKREIDLTIKLLGPFEVLREQGRKLAPDAWTLSRALRILCFIASRQTHRATKDSIIETFWPDSPSEDIDKNFWPTISYIRRALNSNQDVKKNFIRYREGAYYLNPEFNYSIDSHEFEKLITLSRNCRNEGDTDGFVAAARSAVELYRGDLLEEVYDNWVEEPRKYYQSSYITMLKELADHHHRAGDYEDSITFFKMILNRDPYREDVHRQLMDCYARTGNRAALREQYENLKVLLREELGVDPLRETVAAYEELVSHS